MPETKNRLVTFMSFFCFILILCSCGSSGSPVSSNNRTTPTTLVTPTPSPIVPTQTDCPPANTARAAIMPSITLGTDPNIFTATKSNTELVFNRYDVTTGQTTQVISLPQPGQEYSLPLFARLSNDGQWVIFDRFIGTQNTIQMVRVDGQELQTLYCGAVNSILLSPDQKTLAFNLSIGNLEMLDMSSGKLQTVYTTVKDDSGNTIYYQPVKWQTNTSLFVMKELDGRGGIFDLPVRYNYGIYLVKDTTLDSNSQSTNLESMFITQHSPSNGDCLDFDMNQDQILTSDCTLELATLKGPSTIQIQTLSGNASSIYSEPNNAIMYARFASPTKILFCTQNMAVHRDDTGYPTTTTQNVGFWAINTDGTGLTQIATFPDNSSVNFSQTANTPSYIVSRDGSQYLVNVGPVSSQSKGLFFGKLQGTSATPVPGGNSGADQYTVAIGWSTF